MVVRALVIGVILLPFVAVAGTAKAAGLNQIAAVTGRSSSARAAKTIACYPIACAGKLPPTSRCTSWSKCPVTPRLSRRVTRVSGGPAVGGCDCEPIIRSQFAPKWVKFGQTVQMGSRAKSFVVYNMGHPYGLSRETFVSTKSPKGWLVANIYCTGKPSTTIFHSPVNPCYKEPPS
jgi:hypothetical protein